MLSTVLPVHVSFVEGEECVSGHLCCRCCHPDDRRSSTDDAFLRATAAETWSHDVLVSEHLERIEKVMRETHDRGIQWPQHLAV